MLQGFNVSK